MSDAQLRARQRAWESNPGDQEALAAYIAALRGAGEVVPLELVSQRLFPARTLEVLDGWNVSVERVGSSELTELSVGAGSLLEVPEHRRLIVAIDTPEELQVSWEPLAAQGVAELALGCVGLTGAQLSRTASLPDLEVLQLFNAKHLRGKDWAFLGSCSSLHTLTTDHLDLTSLENLPPSLQALDVGAVDPSTLARIVELAPGLRCLGLSGDQLAETDFARLQELPELSSLRIEQPLSFSLEALIGLASLDLETLRLGRGTELPEETLQHIADSFPTLRRLELAESFEDLDPLSPLTLERLSLTRFVDARQLIEETLERLPITLRSLELSASLGDTGLRALARLSEITDLDLHISSDVRREGLSALAGLPRVRTFRLSACDLEPETSSALLEVESLTDLALSETTDEQIARLGCLSRLRSLTLWARHDALLTSSGLECLEGLPRLESLSLSGAQIDRSLAPSHGFQHLEDLSLVRSEVSREALADIAKCSQLWLLYLYQCGPLEGVEVLTDLPQLENLCLSPAASLSEEALAHLRANLPEGVLHLGT